MRYRIIILSLVTLLSSQLLGQIDNSQTITKTGTTSAAFLKITPDARSAALGNAFTAVNGDFKHKNPGSENAETHHHGLGQRNNQGHSGFYLLVSIKLEFTEKVVIGYDHREN